jgi:hypothetical protein
VHYTFSGFNFTPTFLDLMLEVGVDPIMTADHPYQSMAQARAFLDQLPVGGADKARIARGNAEFLLITEHINNREPQNKAKSI